MRTVTLAHLEGEDEKTRSERVVSAFRVVVFMTALLPELKLFEWSLHNEAAKGNIQPAVFWVSRETNI
ncbi:hypothetical protein EYF80_048559 [Liparis tanakae]|uniref:Uncharacterized protein n=1 Tax=Liparis tanakae TaxID=230148 RepID=A0A4Z2FK55_9TELE|nr:hypothetical protein EYF80_048559 [Liparis tanakae]